MGSTSSGSTGGSNSNAHTHGTDSQLSNYNANHSHAGGYHWHDESQHTHELGSSGAAKIDLWDYYANNIFVDPSPLGWTATQYVTFNGASFTQGTGSAYHYGTELMGSTETSALTQTGGPTVYSTGDALGTITLAHTHTTNSQSTTENRPNYMSVKYIIRVS